MLYKLSNFDCVVSSTVTNTLGFLLGQWNDNAASEVKPFI